MKTIYQCVQGSGGSGHPVILQTKVLPLIVYANGTQN